MSFPQTSELTAVLRRVGVGDKAAERELLTLVNTQLRRMAVQRLRHERANHTLQPTALVNELYLRLFTGQPVEWQDRGHFYAVASRQMRFILVDYARRRRRGGGVAVSLDHTGAEVELGLTLQTDEDLLALHEALQQLEAIDPRAARGVELRFFGGLTQQEVAQVQCIDVATVKRDWTFAKSWLFHQLRSSAFNCD